VTLPALLLSRSRLSERRRIRLVAAVTGGVVLSMAVIAAQGFRALPLARLGPLSLGLLAAASIVLLGAYLPILATLLGTSPRRAWRHA
jgi:hypothetical protein